MSKVSGDGAICFWTTSDSTDYITLCQGLSAAGVKQPNPRTPMRALQAALCKLYGAPETLVRPLDEGKGYCVVSEAKGRKANAYATIVTATIDDSGDVTTDPNGSTTAKVQAEWQSQRRFVDARAITPILTSFVEHAHGVRLRDTGGIYWLPASAFSRWQGVANAVEAAGPNVVYTVNVEPTPGTMRAVLAGLTAEIEGCTAMLIEEITAGCLGQRALATRKAAAVLLRKKVDEYVSILGRPLPDLQAMIDGVDQVVAVAAVQQAA